MIPGVVGSLFPLTSHTFIQADLKPPGNILNGSRFPDGISRFIVVPADDQGLFDVYAATTASKLVKLSHDGKQLELGFIRGEEFVPLNRAESTYIINLNFFSFGRWVLGSLLGSEGASNNGGGKGSGYDC